MSQYNDYENQLLLGWDIHQWAVAIARVGLGGTSMGYAEKTRKEYLRKYDQAPLALQLIGVTVDGNYDLASALYEQVEYRNLEQVGSEDYKDSSYGDHGKDDHDYDEGRRNIWTRGV